MRNRTYILLLFSAVLVAVLFLLSLTCGSARIPLAEVAGIMGGSGGVAESHRFIVLESRLPQAVTAALAGAALAASGLLLQTAFRNPLAGPDVFGINSGACLGAALVMLAPWPWMHSLVPVLAASFVGAMAVTAVIFAASMLVRRPAMLLIVGIMTGYMASSAITLLSFFATEQGVKSFMVWGMGTFGSVPLSSLPVFSSVVLVCLLFSCLLVKPLNALLLGEAYAASLGVNTSLVRNLLLVVTGLLTAVTTAFCGPVGFLGLAVPHLARLLLRRSDHRHLLPVCMLCGAAVAMACNLLCFVPRSEGVLPLNAITPMVGAPVIIYVILSSKSYSY